MFRDIVPVLLVLGCLACDAPKTDGKREPAATAERVEAPPQPESPKFTCTRNEDCVVSCVKGLDVCCPELCQCTHAYHVDELARIEAHNAPKCKDASCPIAECAKPTTVFVPECRAGTCAAKEVPWGQQF